MLFDLTFRDTSHWLSSEKRVWLSFEKYAVTERQQHNEYTQILLTFSSGKEGNRRRKDGRVSLTQDCLWCTAAVWPLRQRRIPTKNTVVTGSQKSWGWDKPDVCASLRTAWGILNYKDLRDFMENCRHPDTKITFVFLPVSARISNLPWEQDFC